MSRERMGIVAAVSMPSTGLKLPSAYLAIADQMLTCVSRGDGTYNVYTVYSVWISHEDRLARRDPVQSCVVQFVHAPEGGVVDDLYAATYAEIKKQYDGYEDVQPPLSVVDPEPTAEPEPAAV